MTFWWTPDVKELNKEVTQPSCTCSNLAIETLKQGVKYVQCKQ